MDLAAAFLLGCAVGVAGLVLSRRRRPVATPSEGGRPSDALADPVRNSLAAVDFGILVFDDRGRELYRNRAAELEDLSRSTREVVYGEVRDLIAAAVGDEDGVELVREVDLYGPPKRTFTLRTLPARDPGVGGVIVIEDVTAERHLQEVRKSFVANVSHELRTPVGAIAVLAETLATADDPETIARLCDRISTATHRLGDMIEDLLELSRTEAADMVDLGEVQIASVIEAAVANLNEPAAAKGVSVDIAVSPPDLAVWGDRRQLRSALQNLLDNAIKYSEQGTTVRLSARRQPDWVEVSVADEGIGIPEADLVRVFERFYRVDAARRRNTGGTGLGLSIVRHVVLNHGGQVTVDSAEGSGSTFIMRFPVASHGNDRRLIGVKQSEAEHVR